MGVKKVVGKAKKLVLNKETIADLQERQVQEVRRLIGRLPSLRTCKSIDLNTCLCRTQGVSCTCGPPVLETGDLLRFLLDE